MKREFTNFELETNLELPVTTDNFWKYDIDIKKNGRHFTTISCHHLSFNLANDLLTGDEAKVKDAIECLILNYEFKISELKEVL